LSEEAVRPYERPPLSKGFLTGKMSRERLDLADEDRIAGLHADVRLGVSATRLLVDEHSVEDSMRKLHKYDALIVATGVRPRRLSGTVADDTHVLRTVLDADRLRTDLRKAESLVIVGGGFLGFEVASSARALGVDVTVVEPVASPLTARLGASVADRILALHREHGVRVLTSTSVIEVGRASSKSLVRLRDGRILTADVVLAAIGGIPDTTWLEGSGLDLRNGIGCNAWSRAAPDVYAAGDVARWRHLGLGGDVRIEHRMNATEHGRAVARAILGEGHPYTPVPFVWTDHYGVRIQLAGALSPGATPTLLHGEPGGDAFVVGWRRRQLEAVVGWNAARELIPYRQELAATIGSPNTAGVLD
jgi:NADPH-dependent 2,4-dienoyl-CoA reductase/sulfur reductase-like enzyme